MSTRCAAVGAPFELNGEQVRVRCSKLIADGRGKHADDHDCGQVVGYVSDRWTPPERLVDPEDVA